MASRPVALFVLGVGRSGTSALARVLSLCGGTLPPRLLGATASNPLGYFEPREAIALNQAILRRLGSSGYDVALPTTRDDVVDAEEIAGCVAQVRAYLDSLPPAPLTVIKEPKITLLADIWFEAARLAGFDVVAVVAVRHPDEVVASIAKRADRQHYVRAAPELASAGWLKYSLLAERDTRGMPRVFVEYANLLKDWRHEVKRVSAALSVNLDRLDEGATAIEEFLTSDLRHHWHDDPIVEPFGTDWMAAVFRELSAAAHDDQWDQSELDRVYDEYQVSERGFRKMLVDDQRYRNLNQFMPPFMVRLGLETLALAHRRRGTWA